MIIATSIIVPVVVIIGVTMFINIRRHKKSIYDDAEDNEKIASSNKEKFNDELKRRKKIMEKIQQNVENKK
jgi:hypothetical protein